MTIRPAHVAITGAGGFLGFHTRALLKSNERVIRDIRMGELFDHQKALHAINGAGKLIHIAGVNRGTDEEIAAGNLNFAEQLASVLKECPEPPAEVVFANSIQANGDSIYGQAKAEAADLLSEAAKESGARFVNILLPNLFGEHGVPFYNSVTATFCHQLSRGEAPEVKNDKLLTLLHAQDAASLLVRGESVDSVSPLVTEKSVTELLEKIREFADVYRDGSIPRLGCEFDRDLFNTYRSYLSPECRVIKLDRRSDSRGSFFEVVRARGSSGQTSFSTTVPGVTRGQHFHLRKIERFTVLSGRGRISLRRLFSNEVLAFDVDGSHPVAIDMPTMWAHNVENIGTDTLYTAFWSNDLFDPDAPDTFSEEV